MLYDVETKTGQTLLDEKRSSRYSGWIQTDSVLLAYELAFKLELTTIE